MRKIAAAACAHELTRAALFAKVDRCITRCNPAWLAPDLIDRMLEYVELRLGEAVASDPQHVVGFHRSVGHNGAKFDRFVAYAFSRRTVAKQGGDHVGYDADVDR